MTPREIELAIGDTVQLYKKWFKIKWTTPKCTDDFVKNSIEDAFVGEHQFIEKRLEEFDRSMRARSLPASFRVKCLQRARLLLWKTAVAELKGDI